MTLFAVRGDSTFSWLDYGIGLAAKKNGVTTIEHSAKNFLKLTGQRLLYEV